MNLLVSKKHCRKRDVFAVETGDYAGQMLIVVNVGRSNIGCLSIPTMKNVKIPLKSFIHGRNNGIIKFVERLPNDVYKVSEAQYNKNSKEDENSNN